MAVFIYHFRHFVFCSQATLSLSNQGAASCFCSPPFIPVAVIFIIKQYENSMLGTGTPLSRNSGQATWLRQKRRKLPQPQACHCLQDKYPSLGSHSLHMDNSSQKINNDAICLNLKTCIYKYMRTLPGRGEVSRAR